MFQKLVPSRYHSKCPEYTGFSVIVVKPSESFVEPERASIRLRKGLATLIYAQQWFDLLDADKPTRIYSKDIAAQFSTVLEILEDPAAIWNSAGEKLRPVNMLLDLYGNVYDRLNALQADVKSLAGQPIHVVRERSTRNLINRHMSNVRTALIELCKVMQSMPRHQVAELRQEDRSRNDVSGDSEAEDEVYNVDRRFGITLPGASTEDLLDLRRRTERIRRRRLRSDHLYSVAYDDEQVSEDDSASVFTNDAVLVSAAPSRFDSVFQAYQDLEAHDESEDFGTSSKPDVSERSTNGGASITLTTSDDSAISVSPPRSEDSKLRQDLPSSWSATIEAEDCRSNSENASSLTSHGPQSQGLDTASIKVQPNRNLTSKTDSALLAHSRPLKLAMEDLSRSTSCEPESDFSDLDEACASTVYAVASRVSLSPKIGSERPFKKAVMLQKHKRNESGITYYERSARHDSMTSEFDKFQCGSAGMHGRFDSDSSTHSLFKAGSMYSGASSLSSAQTSPICA